MSNEKHFTISSLTYFWSKIRQIIPFFHAFSNALIDRITSTASSTSVPDFTLIAQNIVELYEGSNLAGIDQSVKSAIDGLSRKFIYVNAGSAISLTNSTAIIPCSNVIINTNSSYFDTDSNGVICKKAGAVLVEFFARANSITEGDRISMQVCRYRNGLLSWDSYSTIGVGGVVTSLSFVRQYITVEVNDTIYLRAVNLTAARGNLNPVRMNIEYL